MTWFQINYREPIEEIKETIENSDSLLSELEDIYIQKKSSLRESQEKLHDLQSIRRANYSKIDYARNNIRVIDDQLTQQMEQIEDLVRRCLSKAFYLLFPVDLTCAFVRLQTQENQTVSIV